jgi:arylsulfatase A-like enzyme
MKSSKVTTPVEFIDIFPTICELAGVAIPNHLDGRSLVPVMKNTKSKFKEFAVSQFPRTGNAIETERLGYATGEIMGYSIRTERYRYTLWLKNSLRRGNSFGKEAEAARELYDYKIDPNETVNVAHEKNYAMISKDLHAKMVRFLQTQDKQK